MRTNGESTAPLRIHFLCEWKMVFIINSILQVLLYEVVHFLYIGKEMQHNHDFLKLACKKIAGTYCSNIALKLEENSTHSIFMSS
jgi:hypothetical protein